MPKIEFGGELRKRREAKDWTQEQLASRADLSVRYIQSLEAMDKMPSLETVFKLSKALSTNPSTLLEPLWKDWKARQKV